MASTLNTITINLANIEQMFNTFDPSPFLERDLDDEAEKFIVGSAREMPAGQLLRLIIVLPEAALANPNTRHLPDAIRNYFVYRIGQVRQELRELLRIGWRSLLVGLTVLVLCLVGVRYSRPLLADSAFGNFAEESLIILGWVANWRPLEIFLYDWWPIWRRIALLQRLAAMPVELRAGKSRPGI